MTAIKQARLKTGLSHRKAAKELGINSSTVVLYERPDRTNFSTEILSRMADLYGTTIDALVGRKPETRSNCCKGRKKVGGPDVA